MKLLYISPVSPALTGNGLAMRAGIVLEALAAHHDVSLYINPLYPPYGPVPDRLMQMCRQVDTQASAFDPGAFDRIHVFRLASLSAAQPFIKRNATHQQACHLDLDDIESLTHERIAALCLKNGDIQLALQEYGLARRSSILEKQVLPLFDRIYVCSEADRGKLSAEFRAEICVLPNAVRIPNAIATCPTHGPMLFVGTLGYYPNDDACRYLAHGIAPLIPEARFQIVGTGVTNDFRQRVSHPAVDIVGEIDDLASAYAGASAVIVPIRAGGGTRIKILEAFAFKRPVITTTLGLEGIEAQPDVHVLIADTPSEFATAYRRLRQQPELAASLVTNAYALLERHYTLDANTRRIAAFS